MSTGPHAKGPGTHMGKPVDWTPAAPGRAQFVPVEDGLDDGQIDDVSAGLLPEPSRGRVLPVDGK